MKDIIWPSVIYYCFLGIFVFYQQLHSSGFRGRNQTFGAILSLSSFAGTITEFVYIGYYGWHISWVAAAIVLGIGILAGMVAVVFERITGPFFFSFLGFVGWPVCAYMMFKGLP